MSTRFFATAAAVLVALVSLSSCGNTIRGVGKDVAGTVSGTQDAGRSVQRAAR